MSEHNPRLGKPSTEAGRDLEQMGHTDVENIVAIEDEARADFLDWLTNTIRNRAAVGLYGLDPEYEIGLAERFVELRRGK